MAAKPKKEDSLASLKASESHLKLKVKELEEEVLSLKRRLDELRKAKNTTILKREREILEVGVPFGRRESKSNDDKEMETKLVGVDEKEMERRLKEKDAEWEREMEELRKKFASEMEALKSKPQEDSSCGHETELEFLRNRNEELENDNAAMTIQNRELRDRVFVLMGNLSAKEASWCDMEEKLKAELTRSWGAKYKEWMDRTEAKIEDLQKTNALLRTYLKAYNPEGSDPTKKDSDFDH
ncbi:myosin-1-like [Physella acuta]|uniref:myosin-1-like n=1 Tax=Physella acuta TaxID=109671 RepID=UPI0027DCC753|nr:myosin-1-like [Physella acuta]XP_059172961.1 myosin-1-like [Physella acuta]XP_059172962.1 myosin-1-like [Physella acuta]